jgi:hypothetical protein
MHTLIPSRCSLRPLEAKRMENWKRVEQARHGHALVRGEFTCQKMCLLILFSCGAQALLEPLIFLPYELALRISLAAIDIILRRICRTATATGTCRRSTAPRPERMHEHHALH